MNASRQVWIIGAGAVGSVIAALMKQAGHVSAILVGQSPHWDAVRAQGLQFEMTGAEPCRLDITTASLTDLEGLGPQDLVLLTEKLPQLLTRTAPLLGDRIPTTTDIVALQNGFGITEIIQGALGRPIDRGLILFGARSCARGHVHYYPGRIRLPPTKGAQAIHDALVGAPIQCEFADDFRAAEWAKLAVNCLANALAGLIGVTNARIGAADLDPAKEAILAEVIAVGRAAGTDLDMTVADFNRYIGGATGDNIPSLHTDLQRGLPTEIDYINGAVVRLGREYGIPTPVNALVTCVIRALESEHPR